MYMYISNYILLIKKYMNTVCITELLTWVTVLFSLQDRTYPISIFSIKSLESDVNHVPWWIYLHTSSITFLNYICIKAIHNEFFEFTQVFKMAIFTQYYAGSVMLRYPILLFLKVRNSVIFKGIKIDLFFTEEG